MRQLIDMARQVNQLKVEEPQTGRMDIGLSVWEL